MAAVPVRRDMGKRPCGGRDPQTGVIDAAVKSRNTGDHQLSNIKGIWTALATPWLLNSSVKTVREHIPAVQGTHFIATDYGSLRSPVC